MIRYSSVSTLVAAEAERYRQGLYRRIPWWEQNDKALMRSIEVSMEQIEEGIRQRYEISDPLG